MNRVIYFDNAASTFIDTEVLDYFINISREYYGNPSSIHRLGRAASKLLQQLREDFASDFNCLSSEVFFTSSATESNNILFRSLDYDLIITSPAEHASVIEPAKASQRPIIWLNLDRYGHIDLEELNKLLQENSQSKILVSLMHVNNETAAIHNIAEIYKLCKQYQAYFHSDISQSHCKLLTSASDFDFASASSHKIHAPRGAGLLIAKYPLREFLLGGSQEAGLRAGTENLAAIAAYAYAQKIYTKKHSQTIELMKYFFEEINKLGLNLHFNSDINESIETGIVNLCFPSSKFKSEELILQYALNNVALASGSACSSNKGGFEINSSYVLRACRTPEEIASKSIRISISHFNTKQDIDDFCEITRKII